MSFGRLADRGALVADRWGWRCSPAVAAATATRLRSPRCAGSDSAYCDTYRAWKVYELDNGEGFDQPDPAALRTWWNEYLDLRRDHAPRGPAEIHDAVEVKVGASEPS